MAMSQAGSKVRNRPGGSNAGKYPNVAKKNFAGPAGLAPEGTFPIDTRARARAALAYARHAPNPEALRRKVYRQYPSLGKGGEARKRAMKK